LLPSNNFKNERLNSHAIISQPKQFILSKEKSLEFDQERLQRQKQHKVGKMVMHINSMFHLI
jgi:hypothetical protein